jgi:ATP-dependent DNA ligase
LFTLGITFIEVPYWWDRKIQSLAATIYSQRPELLTEKPTSAPIPLSPPATHKKEIESSNLLDITTVTFLGYAKKQLMTSTVWEDSQNPTGWYMSEKYDGMRLYWNGSEFLTRQGRKVHVPEFITSQMPQVALDGELW